MGFMVISYTPTMWFTGITGSNRFHHKTPKQRQKHEVVWLWIKCAPPVHTPRSKQSTLLSCASLSLALSLFSWRSLCSYVVSPRVRTSSRRIASPESERSGAGSLFPSDAPGILPLRRLRWRWTPTLTRRCSGRTWRGVRTTIGKGSVTRRRLSSSWTASTPVSSFSSNRAWKSFSWFQFWPLFGSREKEQSKSSSLLETWKMENFQLNSAFR